MIMGEIVAGYDWAPRVCSQRSLKEVGHCMLSGLFKMMYLMEVVPDHISHKRCAY